MTVRAHKVALVQFRKEGLQRRIAKTADLLALQGRVPVIIIKHGRVVERDLEVAVLTGLAIQLALDEAIPPWLNVDRGEACTAEAVLLGFIKVGGLGGLAQTAGFHLKERSENFSQRDTMLLWIHERLDAWFRHMFCVEDDWRDFEF